jgi:hypothetical protein
VLSREDLIAFSLSLFVIAFIAMPGYFIAVLTIESMGRRRIQVIGFAMCAACFFILGVGGNQLQVSHAGVQSTCYTVASWVRCLLATN